MVDWDLVADWGEWGCGENPLHLVTPGFYEKMTEARKINFCVDQTVYPNQRRGLDPATTLNIYEGLLTPSEIDEIKECEKIYFVAPASFLKEYRTFLRNTRCLVYRGGYAMYKGDHISYRYEIKKVLCIGKSGWVAAVLDHKTKQDVALKLTHHNAASRYSEWKTLQAIEHFDRTRVSNCVRLLDYNHFRGFNYIVMNLFDTDLKNYMFEKYPHGMPLDKIAKTGRSILIALDFLAKKGIVHCDVCPSNILLNLANPEAVKLGGFGVARTVKPYFIITHCQTAYYRAPEVFVQGIQTPAIDMWSFGCVMAELVTNECFFHGESTEDQFFAIEEKLGVPTREFMRAHKTRKYFRSTQGREPIHVIQRYGKDVVDITAFKIPNRRKLPGATPLWSFFKKPEEKNLKNFLMQVFRWAPKRRITPQNALKHKFFK
ncbi:hypothetical protein GCK72_024706 [Caenorhabditis remanei]|uniref:Protein kinase domain-containing protein n=1 Tax=Caenorhabditis remanei TaxID=31234 RepID=A0A6A5G121_CAERE|nr:hypothetical protein GCK72_024706 [Caenorhabditis remanei]KAF1748239.1 hypothetical protein GCK72_024706 [Caenorhabditis remanei]